MIQGASQSTTRNYRRLVQIARSVAPDTREGNDEPVEIKGRRGRGRAVDSLPARRAGAQSRGSGERRRGGGRGEEERGGAGVCDDGLCGDADANRGVSLTRGASERAWGW
jgi:hypothetical protein